MSFLIEQTNLLNKLTGILSSSFSDKFDKLKAEYEYLERYKTISTSYSYIYNEKEIYFDAPQGAASKNLDFCEELRSLMKENTGGEWISFTLTLDAEGKAITKFNYPEE